MMMKSTILSMARGLVNDLLRLAGALDEQEWKETISRFEKEFIEPCG